MPLVDLVHAALATAVRPGDVAVDATAGNGHDTVALARLVGTAGRVFAFDVQQVALDRTAARMHELGFANVTLLLRDHAELRETIPAEHHGRLAAVVFNLGYLPLADKRITTRPVTTAAALRAAAELLRPGGLVSVLAYTGHAAGAEEIEVVRAAFERLRAEGWAVSEEASEPGAKPGPHLWMGEKR